jgi:tetratricopeptide (TPR) repeat protein
MKRFELPPAPPTQTGPVKAWAEPVLLKTYAPAPPDRNPMFLERRVYQGSSSPVYPLPFTDRISTEPRHHPWQALHIENQYIRVMVLPEIGGRIHVGLDKTNGYDFFYRQNVIKPALVGLAGPWISGGVEFNWPQHHRPATFMPVNWQIEESVDGSRTIWCSDHDPMNRLKGMHGICLYPDRAYLELKVRLYNRTPFVHTFLWWANVATHVHEYYQSFFPPDVHFVADHAKRAMSTFPLCDGRYYGVDYAARARNGIPADELPAKFVPPGTYPPNDLSWYANIPVPTSYMAMGSHRDFCGAYDHAQKAGLVHVANHHISPGKKQWTWGNHHFGYAWDRNLTDEDGPYIELMAGVYTDNQPDFSFLAPGETKTFSQFWYPIQKIGPVQEANREAAISLQVEAGAARLGLCTTRSYTGVHIELRKHDQTIAEWLCNPHPGAPFLTETAVPKGADPAEFSIRAATEDNRVLIRYAPRAQASVTVPAPATEPRLPSEIAGNDELFVTGLHLDQYRHATRHPETYWQEALRRDPGDARCNHALGLWHLRRGEFTVAKQFLRRSIERLTLRNPNPANVEPFYSLGLTLRNLGRDEEAYAVFYKSTWNYAWRSAGYLAVAEIDMARGAFENALEHLNLCLRTNADCLNARNLTVVALRKLGRRSEAEAVLAETLALDPLDYWARHLADRTLGDNQARLDVAFDLLRSGLCSEAKSLLETADLSAGDGSVPMVLYTLGYTSSLLGHMAHAQVMYGEAAAASPDYCFPSRLEELVVLEAALQCNPDDARAHYYIGNWLFDRRRHEEAITHWERSAALGPSYSVVWRNLGIAYFNVRSDPAKARSSFERAVQANPKDARLRYERDQLYKRIGVSAANRLAELETSLDLVSQRDDLTVELADVYNQTGQPHRAAALFRNRRFQPWEGGEGAALGQYVRTQVALGLKAIEGGDAKRACILIEAALHPPENLGEAWHLLANRSNVYYWLGVACEARDDHTSARGWWTKAAETSGDFQQMSIRPFSEMTYYSADALKQLGRPMESRRLLRVLLRYARQLARTEPRIDYFATSLPAMLLFSDDVAKRNSINALFLEAQAALALGYAKRGHRLLSRVLQLDPSHAKAADLEAELRTETALADRAGIRA